MLEREEARRLLQEQSESWPWATDVTRVTRTAAHGGEPAPLDELGFRIVEIVAHQNAAEYELLTLLAEFDDRRGWAASHSSCVEWLIHHTGESAVACRERLRVAHALPDLPRTRAAMARGELGYTKVKELTRLATPENETALVELARHATVRQLKTTLSGYKIHSRKGEEALARWQQEQRRLSVHPEVTGMYKLFAEFPPEAGAFIMRAMEHFGRQVHGTNTDVTPQQRFADALLHALELAVAADDQAAPTSGSRAARTTVLLHVDPATLSNHPDAEGQLSHLHDGMRVTRVTSQRMACDAGLVHVTDAPDGTPMDVGRKTRTISPALRRALDTRDGHCRFPHCEHRITDVHHITHWIDRGATDLNNLVLLCRHHHTLVHEMGYSMEMSARGTVRFRTPQGIPVPDQPDAVALAGRIEGALMLRNRARGVDPAAWAAAVPVRKLPWEVEERALEALDV